MSVQEEAENILFVVCLLQKEGKHKWKTLYNNCMKAEYNKWNKWSEKSSFLLFKENLCEFSAVVTQRLYEKLTKKKIERKTQQTNKQSLSKQKSNDEEEEESRKKAKGLYEGKVGVYEKNI